VKIYCVDQVNLVCESYREPNKRKRMTKHYCTKMEFFIQREIWTSLSKICEYMRGTLSETLLINVKIKSILDAILVNYKLIFCT